MSANRQQKLLVTGMALAIAAVLLLIKTRAPHTPLSIPSSSSESSTPPSPPSASQPHASASEVPAPGPDNPSTLTPKQQAFAQKLQETLESLPKKSDLQNLTTSEAHHAPAALVEAGRALGDVAEAIREDSSLVPLAQDFYLACARDDSRPDSVRALCLADLQKRQNGTVEGIPERVRRLSQTLDF